MGIYIKNMEMPTSGELLVIITPNGEVRYKKSVASMWDRTTAVPVSPHGNLADKSEILLSLAHETFYSFADYNTAVGAVKNAKTIIRADIPAEPEEEKDT